LLVVVSTACCYVRAYGETKIHVSFYADKTGLGAINGKRKCATDWRIIVSFFANSLPLGRQKRLNMQRNGQNTRSDRLRNWLKYAYSRCDRCVHSCRHVQKRMRALLSPAL